MRIVSLPLLSQPPDRDTSTVMHTKLKFKSAQRLPKLLQKACPCMLREDQEMFALANTHTRMLME